MGDNMDLAYWAWTIIANANWNDQSDEWREAAVNWRDEFHARLTVKLEPKK